MLGSSDSEAVSELDFAAMNAETSEDGTSSENSVEDLYSGSHSESGESSGSNYESTSSFEARKAKKAAKMRHGSATSKAAAAGRKQLMHIRSAKATKGSPQSIYRKEKAAKKAPPPQKRKTTKQATTSSSEQQSQSSDSNNSTESESEETKKTSAPSRKQKSSNAKNTKPTAEEKRAGSKPRKGVKLPHKAVNEDYEGSQEKGIPVVDSRPGKKRSRAGRPRKEARGGRPRKEDRAADVTELLPPQHAHILPTTAQKRGMRAVEQDGVDDDPMLPEEELRPLIVNELAEDGTFVVNEMQ